MQLCQGSENLLFNSGFSLFISPAWGSVLVYLCCRNEERGGEREREKERERVCVHVSVCVCDKM